ncbi:hypothetical protein MRX96_054285 [Rhipicephalus microplus]
MVPGVASAGSVPATGPVGCLRSTPGDTQTPIDEPPSRSGSSFPALPGLFGWDHRNVRAFVAMFILAHH